LVEVALGFAFIEVGKPFVADIPLLIAFGSSFSLGVFVGGEFDCCGKVVGDIAPRCVSDIEAVAFGA
jgi:hypothetical protein